MRYWIGSAILWAILLPISGMGQGYTLSIVAGGGTSQSFGIPATQALVVPLGVTVDSAGNLLIADMGDFISEVTPGGIISALAGSRSSVGFAGDGGPATAAELYLNPLSHGGIATDPAGNVYFADTGNQRVRKIAANGVITTVAGGGSLFHQSLGGPATAAFLAGPTGVAMDSSGNLYIGDAAGATSAVYKVDTSGIISLIAGCVPTDYSCAANAMSGSLGDGGPATKASIGLLQAVALDKLGNIYIADYLNNRIRKVSTSGTITTVVGSGSGSYQGDGGLATSAGLYQPKGVAVDSAGNIYVVDAGDYRIRMVNSSGTITTIAGNGAQGQIDSPPGNNIPATSASFSGPMGIAIGAGGRVYVADISYGVFKLTPNSPASGTPPSVQSGGVISASAFGGARAAAPGSFVEIYGSNLATVTRGWSGSDFNNGDAPTSLSGTSVTIGGQAAYVAYVSPGQVNVQIPSSAGQGSQPLIVKTAAGSSAAYPLTINATEPGLLAPAPFNIGAKQYIAAFFPDGSLALPPGTVAGVNSHRAKPGDTVTLYGTGFGPVTPNIPAGQIPGEGNTLLLPLTVSFGTATATVTYDGLAPSLVGVYQFNVVVPNVSSSDTVPVTFTLNGVPGTQTLYIPVRN